MEWRHINFSTKTWRIPVTKNGEAQVIPLSNMACKILLERQKYATSKWVFPSENSKSGHLEEPRKGWERILQQANIQDLRLHDLRRSLGSWQASTGASLSVIG